MSLAIPVPPLSKAQTQAALLDQLRLIRSENIGPVTFFALLRRYGTAAKALEAVPMLAARGGAKRPIRLCPREAAEKEIEAATRFGARLIAHDDPAYPSLLKEISDPPPVLSVSGHPHLWQRRCIAMIGARNASANGCHFAKKLAHELGEAGFTIISGLARGIDTFAHRGALASGTVGVIAGGIDNIYPPESTELFASMRLEGAILSENPFGALPHSRAFPARNRIISGMSLGTVVVEASERSGSLITAGYALEQGREVFAVPGSPLDPRSHGCNRLLRQGAVLVQSAADIIEALEKPYGVAEARQFDLFAVQEMPEAPESELERARHEVEEKLGVAPVSVEALLQQLGLPPHVLLTILLEKELAGVLQRHPGGKVSLVAGQSLINGC